MEHLGGGDVARLVAVEGPGPDVGAAVDEQPHDVDVALSPTPSRDGCHANYS
jgi:hypothetical protein